MKTVHFASSDDGSAGPSIVLKTACLLLFLLIGSPWVFGATIAGTVKDPSGAVIAAARIEITGGTLAQPLELTSDALGKFTSPDLEPGKYVLRISHQGFESLEQTVSVPGTGELLLTLAVARVQTNISVPGKTGAFANSDPVYRQLREVGLGDTFRIEGFNLISDVATFHFEKGTLTFLKPVQGMVTGAIFVGDGHFHLKPLTPLDVRELSRRIGADEVDEEFTAILFRFTAEGRLGFLPALKDRVDGPEEAAATLKHWREKLREVENALFLRSPSIFWKARAWITWMPTS